MSPQPSKPTRKDARDDRDRILAAARAELAVATSASLSATARRAGAGIGTLCRHFPTREALIMELYRHDLQHLIDLGPGWCGRIRRWRPCAAGSTRWRTDEVAHYGRLTSGVSEAVHARTGGGADPMYEPFVDAIASLLRAGAADGTLKPTSARRTYSSSSACCGGSTRRAATRRPGRRGSWA